MECGMRSGSCRLFQNLTSWPYLTTGLSSDGTCQTVYIRHGHVPPPPLKSPPLQDLKPNIAAYAYQDVHVWSALLTCLRPCKTVTSLFRWAISIAVVCVPHLSHTRSCIPPPPILPPDLTNNSSGGKPNFVNETKFWAILGRKPLDLRTPPL